MKCERLILRGLLVVVCLSAGILWAADTPQVVDAPTPGVSTPGLSTLGTAPQGSLQTRLVKRFFSIGTASINGMYYPLGTAMTRLFNSNLDGLLAIPEPTAGSVVNLEYLRQKEIALALVQNDVAFNAFFGKPPYANRAFGDLRVLASLYSEVFHVAVRTDSGITSLAELRGKILAIGDEGSGTAVNSRIILEALDFGTGDFIPSWLGFTKATAALEGGYVDAVFFTGGLPLEGFALLGKRVPIRLLPFPAALAAKLTAAYPFLQEEIIPAGTYPGQTEPVSTVGLRALLVTTGEFPGGLARQMLQLIFDNIPYLASRSQAARGISLTTATKGVPPEMLHEGARQFFLQRGLRLGTTTTP